MGKRRHTVKLTMEQVMANPAEIIILGPLWQHSNIEDHANLKINQFENFLFQKQKLLNVFGNITS